MASRAMILGSVIAAVAMAGVASAASFDCSKAGAAFEKFVCSNPSLNEADTRLGAAYGDAMKKFVFPEIIRYDQRQWLATYRQCKGADKCVQLVNARIADLESWSSATVYSDSDGRFAPDGQTVILRKAAGKEWVRIFGSWMPDGNMDPGKMKGFPADGFLCDDEGELKRAGNTMASQAFPDLKMTLSSNSLAVKGFHSCSPRTGFGDASLKKRQ